MCNIGKIFYMNIGIYSPYLNTLTGGEKYIFTSASCLSKEHKVTIFWDDVSILDKASEKFDIDLSKVTVSPNIFNSSTSFFYRILKTLKYDRILYLSDGSIPIVGCRLLIHFQFPVEWLNTNSFVFLFKRSRISKIICNSYFTKHFIDRKFNRQSYVLYPPASTNTEDLPSKEKLILTVGRFSQLPNGSDFKKLPFLVGSFKKFQKKRLKGWKMAIVTSVQNDSLEEFNNFVSSIKSSHITIYKNASHETIKDLYRKASIYWHAAGYGEDLSKYPERAEHFGISTVEAMSYGAIPVVIAAGGQKEIIKDKENGFLWEDEDELLKFTHRLAVDTKLSSRMRESSVDSVKRFTKDRFCEELNHLIW